MQNQLRAQIRRLFLKQDLHCRVVGLDAVLRKIFRQFQPQCIGSRKLDYFLRFRAQVARRYGRLRIHRIHGRGFPHRLGLGEQLKQERVVLFAGMKGHALDYGIDRGAIVVGGKIAGKDLFQFILGRLRAVVGQRIDDRFDELLRRRHGRLNVAARHIVGIRFSLERFQDLDEELGAVVGMAVFLAGIKHGFQQFGMILLPGTPKIIGCVPNGKIVGQPIRRVGIHAPRHWATIPWRHPRCTWCAQWASGLSGRCRRRRRSGGGVFRCGGRSNGRRRRWRRSLPSAWSGIRSACGFCRSGAFAAKQSKLPAEDQHGKNHQSDGHADFNAVRFFPIEILVRNGDWSLGDDRKIIEIGHVGHNRTPAFSPSATIPCRRKGCQPNALLTIKIMKSSEGRCLAFPYSPVSLFYSIAYFPGKCHREIAINCPLTRGA